MLGTAARRRRRGSPSRGLRERVRPGSDRRRDFPPVIEPPCAAGLRHPEPRRTGLRTRDPRRSCLPCPSTALRRPAAPRVGGFDAHGRRRLRGRESSRCDGFGSSSVPRTARWCAPPSTAAALQRAVSSAGPAQLLELTEAQEDLAARIRAEIDPRCFPGIGPVDIPDLPDAKIAAVQYDREGSLEFRPGTLRDANVGKALSPRGLVLVDGTLSITGVGFRALCVHCPIGRAARFGRITGD